MPKNPSDPLLFPQLGVGMSDIFISYSREDSKFVEALILALIENGWSVWSDKSAVAEGRPFDTQIENAILEAGVTLVIWSRGSVKSRWVRAEASFALGRDKLVPVIADDVDPPLQFLHIHGVNFAGWDGTSDDLNFKKLAEVLSRRLDRVGRIPKSENESKASGKLNLPSSDGTFTHWRNLLAAFLPAVGPGFDEYFTHRTFFIAQFACGLAFCLVTLFSLMDLLVHSGMGEMLFRTLVAAPLFLILLALSFTRLARRHSQKFVFAFGVVALLVVFRSSQMFESTFPVTTGATMGTFLIVLAVMTLLPLRTLNASILGLLALLLHESYISLTHTPVPLALHAGYSLCVLSAAVTLVAVAYFRERLMRNSFLDYEEATAKVAELKDRLMTLAVERNQAKDPPPYKPVREKKIFSPLK